MPDTSKDSFKVVPSASATLSANADIVLIGSAEAEECFLEICGKSGAAS